MEELWVVPVADAGEVPAELVERLRDARHVVVLTGAGVSAESGLATFRDAPESLWSRYRPEDLATPEAFERNPALVWDWYAWRREQVLAAGPNAAHRALAGLERLVPRVTVVTQNVDGLHQRAGSSTVVTLHGDITRARCSAEGTVVAYQDAAPGSPPPCPACGAFLRPDVVWFGEQLPEAALLVAARAVVDSDLVVVAGTSGTVEPAASLQRVAARTGAPLVLVNPVVAPMARTAPFARSLASQAGATLGGWSGWTRGEVLQLEGPAGRVFPAMLAAAWP